VRFRSLRRGQFLRYEGLGELGYGFAYRVLDAQHFGVPQRRRRVFVVGHLGDWRSAAAVLFERHSLSGHPAPRRNSGEGITASLGGIAGGPAGDECYNLIGGWDYENNAHGPDEPTGPLLKGSPTGGGRPLPAVAFAQNSRDEVREFGGDGQTVGALAAEAGAKQQCYIALQSVNCPRQRKQNGIGISEGEAMYSLTGRDLHGVQMGPAVRRLTPRECERLQGFPDDYTLVPYRGKPAADGPRYKALGNSMAVPVMRWIGERIAKIEALQVLERAA
jgi:DNA (cytosine-5)-methyltransferase 1